jgi:hypothetical protein
MKKLNLVLILLMMTITMFSCDNNIVTTQSNTDSPINQNYYSYYGGQIVVKQIVNGDEIILLNETVNLEVPNMETSSTSKEFYFEAYNYENCDYNTTATFTYGVPPAPYYVPHFAVFQYYNRLEKPVLIDEFALHIGNGPSPVVQDLGNGGIQNINPYSWKISIASTWDKQRESSKVFVKK